LLNACTAFPRARFAHVRQGRNDLLPQLRIHALPRCAPTSVVVPASGGPVRFANCVLYEMAEPHHLGSAASRCFDSIR